MTVVADSKQITSSGTVVTTSGVDTTGMNLVVLITTRTSSADAATPITDSNSNTWTADDTQSTGFPVTQAWFAKNPTVGAAHTFSYHTTAGTFSAIAVIASDGMDTATQPDGSTPQQTGASNSGTTVTSNSIVTANATDFLVGGGSNETGGSVAQTFTNGGPAAATWTQPAAGTINNNAGEPIAAAYSAVSTTGTYSVVYNNTGSGSESVIFGAFRQAGGAVTIPPGLGPVVQMQEQFHHDTAMTR